MDNKFKTFQNFSASNYCLKENNNTQTHRIVVGIKQELKMPRTVVGIELFFSFFLQSSPLFFGR